MDEKILAALRSKDAEMRRKGIIAAGKSGDGSYLKTLNHLIFTDDDASLRELAQKASQHIRSKGGDESAAAPQRPTVKTTRPPTSTRQPKPTPAPSEDSSDAAPSAPSPVTKRQNTARYSVGRMIPFLLFIVVLIGVGALLLWVVAGDSIRLQLYLDNLNARMATASSLPLDGSRAPDTLTGQLFRYHIATTAEFFIQEPSGPMPSGGWPIVMCVAGGTPRAPDCFAWMGERAAREQVLFVSPSFYNNVSGGEGWNGSLASDDTQFFLDDLDLYYTVNWRRSVMYGFSAGAYFTLLYTSFYPLDFAGGVMGGLPNFEVPQVNGTAYYGVITGELDARLTIANQFADQMESRGLPVWREEVVPGVGHDVTEEHIDMVFDLMAELSATP